MWSRRSITSTCWPRLSASALASIEPAYRAPTATVSSGPTMGSGDAIRSLARVDPAGSVEAMATRNPRKFWDRRARENALYFVDSRLDYRAPDADAFWSGGARAVDRVLDSVDARIEPSDVVLDIGCGVGRLTRVLAERARSDRKSVV